MKRLLSGLALCLSLSACSLGPMHPTLYNNKVVELVNPATLAVESSALNYNTLVPDTVTEVAEVDSKTLRSDYNKARRLLNKVEGALDFESDNLEQEASVRSELETYLTAGQEYLSAYESMLLFFEDETYQSDPNQLDDLDPLLHSSYNVFTEANNDLVTTLAGFVRSE